MNKKIIKNWSILTFSNVFQQIINFFVIIPIVRALNIEDYGLFSLILSIVGIFQIISSLGLKQIIIKEIAKNSDYLPIIAKKTLSLVLLSTFIGIIVLILYIKFFENEITSVLLLSSIILLISFSLWNFAEALSFGKEEMILPSIIGVVFSCIWIISIFLLPKSILNIENILLIYSLIQIIKTLLIFLIQYYKNYFKLITYLNKLFNNFDIIKQSLPIYFSNLLTIPISYLPILFLSYNSGNSQVAFYNLGSKISIPFTIIISTLLNALYPSFNRLYITNKIKFRNYFYYLIIFISIVGMLFCIIFSLFGSEIIIVLFGLKYIEALPTFIILLWVTLNLIIHSLFGTVFIVINNQNLMMKLSIMNAFLMGLLNYFGSFYGAFGLSLSMFLGSSISLIIHWNKLTSNTFLKSNNNLPSIIFFTYIFFSVSSMYFILLNIIIKILFLMVITILIIYYVNRHKIEIFKIARQYD